MTTADLGTYATGFAEFRKLMAAVPQDARGLVFQNAATEAANYVSRGLDRTVAADELVDMATAYGLDDTDTVQLIISRAFEHIEVVPDVEGPQETNGRDKQPQKLLPLINIRAWQNVEPAPRRWIVRERIPDRNVTLLTGQGGVGKTLLMQQLSVATVLGKDWIGELPEPGAVLFITAEDDVSELHFRYHLIAKSYGTDFDTLADNGLNLLSLAGTDAAMAVADARGIVKPTELFRTMVRTVKEIRPRWIGLDTAADIFIVNERDRSQVRQCISLLRGIALEFETAVILLSHPSLAGISTGTGLSGSTAWNNSVRSRLYLKSEKKKNGDQENEEEELETGSARILEFMKSNYSALAAPVKLVWRDGLLVLEPTLASLPTLERTALEQKARDLFLAILTRCNRQDIPVSRKLNANNFAPTIFADDSLAKELHKNKTYRKGLLRQAMDHLLQKEHICVGTGPKCVVKSKRTECLYIGGTLL